MRPFISSLVILFSVVLLSSCVRNIQTTEEYYDNGVLKYQSRTIIYGSEDDFDKFNKTVTYVTEYYENGQLELEQKTVERPAFHSRDNITGEPINSMPRKKRKYRRYNRAGELVEEGVEKTGKSKKIEYNVDIYKKIITKTNQEWRYPKVKYYERDD